MHEQYVQEVRLSLQNNIVEDQAKIEADLKQKLEKAAKVVFIKFSWCLKNNTKRNLGR